MTINIHRGCTNIQSGSKENHPTNDTVTNNINRGGTNIQSGSAARRRARAGGQLFASDKRYKVGAGVDAALDKWKGREERMFDKLYQKYDSEIKAKWDKDAEPEKEEL